MSRYTKLCPATVGTARPAPASWCALVADATRVREGALPRRLWQRLGLLPYLPLLLPYRLTADVAKSVNHMAAACCGVAYDHDDVGAGGANTGGTDRGSAVIHQVTKPGE